MFKAFLFSLVLCIVFNLISGISQLTAQCNDSEILNLNFDRIPSSDLEVGFSFCYEVSVENFDSVLEFRFGIEYNASVLEFIALFQSLGNLTGPLVSHSPQPGQLVILWTNANAEGQTLIDNTEIFNVCFEIIADPEDCSPISFCNDLTTCPNTETTYLEDNVPCTDSIILLNNDSIGFCFTLQDSLISSSISSSISSQEDPTVLIYPNPASDNLNVKFDKLSSISIYNLTGEQVYFCDVEKSQNHLNIDVMDYPNSMYILKTVDIHSKVYSEKFVVKR
jgi:hypothetical protein